MTTAPLVAAPNPGARFAAGLLGVAVVLTSATQLRINRLPIGPGELALSLLAAWAAFGIVVRGRIQVSTPLLLLLAFWIPALSLMGIGWMAGLALDHSSLAHGRDLLAMGFVSSVFILWIAREGHSRYLSVAEVTFAVGGVAALTGLGALWFLTRGESGPISIWYEGIRFRGWAENPNQLALLLLPMPVILARRTGQATGAARRGWAVLLLWAVGMGMATASDALTLSWSMMAASWLLLVWIRAVATPATTFLRAGIVHVLLPLTLLAGVAFSGRVLVQAGSDLATSTSLEGGQGDDRLLRWAYGIDALAESPLVGLGPGAFSGRSGPFQDEEAHSTPIDWATSTGALGLLLLILFQFCLLIRATRQRDFGDLILLGGLVTFSLFHYVLRQPVFWFVATVILARTVTPRGHPQKPARG